MELQSLSPKYSLLFANYGSPFTDEYRDRVLQLLENGVKVILFLDGSPTLEGLERFEQSNLLSVFISAELNHSTVPTPCIVVDGQFGDVESCLDQIAELNPSFNVEQYRIEHAPPEQHLSVEAGAGTGKTTVMVQRILFLLHMTDVTLKDIVMITFTRDAAKNMFRKLRKEFLSRFQLTGNQRYIRLIEELNTMQISTIHSFAKKLVQQLGSVHGFGTKVQIRSFGLERKRLIEGFLDEFLAEWMEKYPVTEKLQGLRLYELVKKVVDFWEEMERKGFSREEIGQLQWGTAAGESAGFQEMFQTLFAECERRFQNLKEEENAISLNDLTRQIDMIARSTIDFRNVAQPIQYLFVDEFQDTDDTQIRLITSLQRAFDSSLFVVGDIKQSIYRFRGANYTAFTWLKEMLEEQNGQKMTGYPLVKNYRTAGELLGKIDKIFAGWGEKEYLVYETPLIGMKHDAHSLNIERVSYDKDDARHPVHTIRLVRQALEDVRKEKERLQESEETPKVAVLVRTNREAQRVKEWFEDAGIFFDLEIGGTFFTSDAVNDFASLVEALLYPTNPQSMLNLYATSYSQVQIDWIALVPCNGERERLLEILHQHQPFPEWKDCVKERIRLEPILSVLRGIIEKTNPYSRYRMRQEQIISTVNSNETEYKAEALKRAKQYRRNLNQLFEMIHDVFSNDFLTLYSLNKWLKLNQAINRDVDEPKLPDEERDGRVQIMTVHRSKGLEFHTVIVPFTERSFRWEENDSFSELLFKRESDGINAGWLIRHGEVTWENSKYSELAENEREEVIREEARLLYVAMTRCEKQLWMLNNRKYAWGDKVNSWSALLGEGV
ncbi:UvrD-helicase domain-containing protein [Tumebacillus sp. DT12]|uniref:DNA 3'-5' helicase n=1 Tax=Tumebacillus lacus TaxID=2995335 RepID=A0ABT3X4B5_9BACL|nr:UvrD-helicase domain-containing protein [Tumebacillus lacus]MCX7571734.1 UvrD-helicase domain-containing protein [Tumebacillus lacus]